MDKDLGDMSFIEAWQEGQNQSKIKSTGDAILRAFLVTLPLFIAIHLPIAWYWKILAFLGMFQVIAVMRTVVRYAGKALIVRLGRL